MCGLTGEGAGGQRVGAAAPALGIWPAHQQCLHYCLPSVAIERPLGRAVQAGDPAQRPRSCTGGPVGEVQAGLCVGNEGLGSREELGTLALLHPFAPVPVRPLLFQGSRQQSPAPHTRVQAPTTHQPQQAFSRPSALGPPTRLFPSLPSCLWPLRLSFPLCTQCAVPLPPRCPLPSVPWGPPARDSYPESRRRCRGQRPRRPRAYLGRAPFPAALLPRGRGEP